MELEILELVFDYSIKGKLADNQFVDKIIEIVVKKRNLNDYVRDVIFTTEQEGSNDFRTTASYNHLTRRIQVNYKNILIDMECFEYCKELFNSLEQIMVRNFKIAQIILHELEHALQTNQADGKNGDSVELKLINASLRLALAIKNPNFLVAQGLDKEISLQEFRIYCERERKLYEKYYDFNPAERMAEINSLNTIILSLEPIKKAAFSLYGFECIVLFKTMLNAYQLSKKEGICPTQVYLEGTRRGNVWTEFDFYDANSAQLFENVSAEYDFGKRISLGLPISQDEFNMMDSAKIQM